jgi:hypothetical protein
MKMLPYEQKESLIYMIIVTDYRALHFFIARDSQQLLKK